MRFSIQNELFDVYSKSLNAAYPGTGDVFVCPLCLEAFGRDAIDNRSMSVEHVPPRAVGPIIKTMTCRRCNNTAGNRLDNQLKRYVQEKEFMAGRVPEEGIPAQVRMGGAEWPFLIKEMVPGERRMSGILDSRHVAPKVWPADMNVFRGKEARISLRLRYSQDAVAAAYLRLAYLALFHYMGYPYIMQPALEPIRKKIISFSTDGEKHMLRPPGLWLDPKNTDVEIGMLFETLDKSCLAVIVAGEVVAMPFMDDSYRALVDVLRKASIGEQPKEPISGARLLIDPGVRFATTWQFESSEPIDGSEALRLVASP